MDSPQNLFITTWQKHSCGGCNMYYYDYKHLLEHLYWKHGTESVLCNECGLKKWKYAKHFCHVLPIDDVFIENFKNDDDDDELTSSSDESDMSCSLTVTEFEYTEINTMENQYDMNQNCLQHPMVQSYLKYSADQAVVAQIESPYCYCRKHVEDTQMIGCDGPTCPIQWYHFSCVGIITPPDGDWLCPKCRPKKSNKVVFLFCFSLLLIYDRCQLPFSDALL